MTSLTTIMSKQRIRLFSATVVLTLFAFLKASAQNTSPYWSLSGNSNVTSSTKLGTTNAVSLRLYTKNLERLRIDTLGRVGIGLTSFKGKFNVLNGTGTPSAAWMPTSTMPLFMSFSDGATGSGDFILATASGSASVRSVLI